jgi:hypothetical protein
VAFTPSGSGTHARITKGTALSESETHWVIWASETGTDGPFYELAEVAVGTTTYDDNTAPADYDNGEAAQTAGTFTVPTSVKYLLSDGGNRLLMAGAHESGGYTSRVWFTVAQGSLGRGDDERIPQQTTGLKLKYYLDLDEEDGGGITGLAGPLNGQPIVFKQRQTWRLVPTGDVDAPYRPVCISKQIGCVDHRSIAVGIDETGATAIYFWAREGPYRIGPGGLQFLGMDITDLTDANIGASVRAVYYPKRRQYWASIDATQDVRVRFHCLLGRPDGTGAIRGGWARDAAGPNGSKSLIDVRSLVAFSDSPGGSTGADESTLRPHVLTGEAEIIRCDEGTTDDGGAFQAYTETKPYAPAGAGVRVTTGIPLVIGKSASGTPTITVTQIKNYSAETRDATCALSTQRAHVPAEDGGGIDNCDAVAFRVGDGSASSAAWTLDGLVVPYDPLEQAVSL